MLEHRFGMDEVVTKLNILRDEFTHLHDYNPIESVSSRLKSPESLVEKIGRKGIDLTELGSFDEVRQRVTDIAGVRVVCSFASDVYRVYELLARQQDITILEVRDYIKAPKANGYRSLHTLVEVPVFLSGGQVPIVVEVQFRTIAMDFWASLEHKIHYKYRQRRAGRPAGRPARCRGDGVRPRHHDGAAARGGPRPRGPAVGDRAGSPGRRRSRCRPARDAAADRRSARRGTTRRTSRSGCRVPSRCRR